jgi:Fe-S-cluster-containing hydrogenase component 2
MSTIKDQPTPTIESYKFHHIDTSKCLLCKKFSCENTCFRGIYKVINKESEPKSIIVKDREDLCVKCHMCTTACKLGAIIID